MQKNIIKIENEQEVYSFTRYELQRIVDAVFQINLTIQEGYFKDKPREDLAKWVAENLSVFGLKTKPCGSSWGSLVDD